MSVVTICHDDQRGEEPFRDDTALKADVDDDQLHQTARIHQRADAERFAIRDAGGARGQPASHAFAQHRRHEHRAAHQPEETGIEQADFCVQARVGEEERKQQRHRERLDAPDEITNHHAAWHGGAHDERAEDRVQTDQIGEPRAERHERERHDQTRLR